MAQDVKGALVQFAAGTAQGDFSAAVFDRCAYPVTCSGALV